MIRSLAAMMAMTVVCGAAVWAQGAAPMGVAIAQGPAGAAALCHGRDEAQAAQCVLAGCAALTGAPESCDPPVWRPIAGWCAELSLSYASGARGVDYLCGFDARPALHSAIRARCAAGGLTGCVAERQWSPDGRESLPEN